MRQNCINRTHLNTNLHESHVVHSSVFLWMTFEMAFATTLSAWTEGCSSSYLPLLSNSTCALNEFAHQRKLSWSVPTASVHTPGSVVLSFSSKTQACTDPVTFSGAVPFRYSCGRAKMSAKRECESNKPAGHW